MPLARSSRSPRPGRRPPGGGQLRGEAESPSVPIHAHRWTTHRASFGTRSSAKSSAQEPRSGAQPSTLVRVSPRSSSPTKRATATRSRPRRGAPARRRPPGGPSRRSPRRRARCHRSFVEESLAGCVEEMRLSSARTPLPAGVRKAGSAVAPDSALPP